MTTDKHPAGHSDEDDDGPPTKREAQQPIGPVDADDTWLSGDDPDDPLRDNEEESRVCCRPV